MLKYRITLNALTLNLTAFILSIFLICSGCGYKAAPSPYLDEEERFTDEIYSRKEQQNKKPEVSVPNIFTNRNFDSQTENKESGKGTQN